MGIKEDNVLKQKSLNFAVRIVNMYKYLVSEKKEYVLAKQILRSGTSIGANVAEANEAYSKKDFEAKIYIALKEARETEYWLQLLYMTEFINNNEYQDINDNCVELIKLLVSITKTLREKQENNN